MACWAALLATSDTEPEGEEGRALEGPRASAAGEEERPQQTKAPIKPRQASRASTTGQKCAPPLGPSSNTAPEADPAAELPITLRFAQGLRTGNGVLRRRARALPWPSATARRPAWKARSRPRPTPPTLCHDLHAPPAAPGAGLALLAGRCAMNIWKTGPERSLLRNRDALPAPVRTAHAPVTDRPWQAPAMLFDYPDRRARTTPFSERYFRSAAATTRPQPFASTGENLATVQTKGPPAGPNQRGCTSTARDDHHRLAESTASRTRLAPSSGALDGPWCSGHHL